MHPVLFHNTDQPDVLELKNVTQAYPGGKTIMKDVNFLVEDRPGRGEFAVVLGKSGCGKSTILRYFAGLQAPTSGEVLINGKAKDSKDSISMVFQQYSSPHFMTVLENVMLPLILKNVSRKEAKEKAMEFIKTVGLEGHENKYTQYPKLSGGQLQRVAIARSLIANPEIILMDEPFGALDTNTRSSMQLMVADLGLRLNTTVVFVTHDIPEAVFLADDIYIMGGKPANIVEHIAISLPFPRTKEIKRTTEFTQLVAHVEDMMDYVDAATQQQQA